MTMEDKMRFYNITFPVPYFCIYQQTDLSRLFCNSGLSWSLIAVVFSLYLPFDLSSHGLFPSFWFGTDRQS